MLNRIAFSVSDELKSEVLSTVDEWKRNEKVSRIWKKDASVWTDGDESKWLGWLDIVDEELGNASKYQAFHADIVEAGFRDILLMGMGGSSLCPEVLAMTFGRSSFHILDSTVPAQIRAIEDKIDVDKTLFIVASKSGSTLEPNCFKQYFFNKVMQKRGKEAAGRQFVAITDPGSKMEQIAKADGFRHIFHGKPEVGGRFSALSAFGLTAAAAMGLDVKSLLEGSKEMAESCRENGTENTGLLLGIILGVCQRRGVDKLTIFTGNAVHDLGAWLEQLVAESTGKNGVAIVPVDREPAVDLDLYGDDRVFVSISAKDDRFSDEHVDLLNEIKTSRRPFVDIELDSIENIGQEFFRWEFATAVAGSVMGINPFDQPDVEAAKIEARKLTDEYEKAGSLPAEQPFFQADGISFFSGEDYAAKLMDTAEEKSLGSLLEAHLLNIHENDYFALLAYIQMSDENQQLVQSVRAKVLASHAVATCVGFGPRFLHSTGQAYKGGPNSGVFLQITSDDEFDLPVPDQKYTFGVVKAAQARGDFQVLLDRGRRALRVHLSADVRKDLQNILEAVG